MRGIQSQLTREMPRVWGLVVATLCCCAPLTALGQYNPYHMAGDSYGACANGDCNTQGNCNFDCCPRDPVWMVDARGVYLTRGELDSTPILQNSPRTQVELSGSDFDPGYEPGVDVRFARNFDPCSTVSRIEFRYYAVYGWEDSFPRALPNGNNVVFTNSPFGNGAPQQWLMQYDSQFQSFELNAFRDGAFISWFGGARVLSFSEHQNLGFNVPTIPQLGNYLTETENTLVGLQLGADCCLFEGNRLVVNAGVVAGLYANFADNSTILQNQLNGGAVNFEASDNGEQAALVSEASLDVQYRVTDHVALVAGYQLMWLEGVAVAADQISSQSIDSVNGGAFVGTGKGIDIDGNALFHGATFGAVLTY